MKKQYTIKGTGCQEYGKNIIKFFEQLGGWEHFGHNGVDEMYFFIDSKKRIDFAETIPPNHTEIELLPNGIAKGVWYKDDGVDFIKPKKIKEETEVHGETIYTSFDHIKFYKKDWWDLRNFKTATPLADLTEIELLPNGHEDKEGEYIKTGYGKTVKVKYDKPDKDLVNYLVKGAKQSNITITINENGIMIYGITSVEKAIKQLQKLIQ
jgi:hypothetical protein